MLACLEMATTSRQHGGLSLLLVSSFLSIITMTTAQNYSDYYSCMMTDNNMDIFRRCDTFSTLRMNFLMSGDDYCSYAYERAECFVHYSNHSCSAQVTSYILNHYQHAEWYYNNNYCYLDASNISLHEELFPVLNHSAASCNDVEFMYCAAEIDEMAFIVNVMEGLLFDNYWYYDLINQTTFSKNYTVSDICRNWNNFKLCASKTGCSFEDVANIVMRNSYSPGWVWYSPYYTYIFNSTLETMLYICQEDGSTIEQACRSSSLSECSNVTVEKYNYPHFRMDDLCSIIYDDAVCVYNEAKRTCNNRTSLMATVEVRVEYQRLWWYYIGDNWNVTMSFNDMMSAVKGCVVNFEDVETQTPHDEPCGKDSYFRCLVRSYLTQYLYWEWNVVSDILSGRFDFATHQSCRQWDTFKSCFQCNATFFDEIDFATAYTDYIGYVNPPYSYEVIEEHRRSLLNEAMTPRRLELMCGNHSEGYVAYKDCSSNLQDGSLYTAFQDCQQEANAAYDVRTLDAECRYYELWSSCLYNETVRRCTEKAGIYIMNYFTSEWTNYLRKSKGCFMEIRGCESVMCLNGGTCGDNANGAFNCSCAAGFAGVYCETDVDECTSNPCRNGGSCIDQINSYSCSCTSGFTGVQCETDVDECASDPCQNGGYCADQINGYSCSCTSGFTGIQCETDNSLLDNTSAVRPPTTAAAATTTTTTPPVAPGAPKNTKKARKARRMRRLMLRTRKRMKNKK